MNRMIQNVQSSNQSLMLLLIFTFFIQTPTYYNFLESLWPEEDKIGSRMKPPQGQEWGEHSEPKFSLSEICVDI